MTRKHVATQTPWTQKECARAAELWQREIIDVYGDSQTNCRGAKIRTFQLIARTLSRTVPQIQSRYAGYGPLFNGKTGYQHREATERQLAERDARRAGYDLRSTTQVFCGDPPIGFSALERQKGLGHSRHAPHALSAVTPLRHYETER